MTSALNRDLNRVYPLLPPSSSAGATSRPQTAASAGSRNAVVAGNTNETVATVDLAFSDNDEEAGKNV